MGEQLESSLPPCLALLAAQVPPHAQDKEEGHEGQDEQNFHVRPLSMKLPAASCGVSCEILRSRYPPSPRLRRVLLAFIPAASYGVFGEGE
jgi:hypothetical protein